MPDKRLPPHMNKEINYYQVIEGTEMYYPWYVNKLKRENKALKQLLEWAIECDFGFDNFVDYNFDANKFKEETKDMTYTESMIYYAERWLEENDKR